MEEQTALAKELDKMESKEQYDTHVKNLLSYKIILAWILKYTVKEFARSSLDDIQQCIEGTPEIGTTAVDTGLTNVDCITGMNTEDGVSNEGKVTYDIKFYVLLPNKEHTKIIINIEAQKDSSPGYDLVTRAVFYCARMLSSQLNKEFTNHRSDKIKYDGIKKVYSIWVCMDSTKNTKNSIVEFSMQQNNLFGEIKKEYRYDLLSVVMIHLGGDDMKSEHKLVNMLTTLLSKSIKKEQKKKKLKEEFAIPMVVEFEKEIDEMCNLSDYIEEKSRAEGRREGRAEGEQRMIFLYNWLAENDRKDEFDEAMKPENETLRSKLYEEYSRAKKKDRADYNRINE